LDSISEDDDALRGAVDGVARGEHELLVADVADDRRIRRIRP
jgi:hypothetical protein